MLCSRINTEESTTALNAGLERTKEVNGAHERRKRGDTECRKGEMGGKEGLTSPVEEVATVREGGDGRGGGGGVASAG